MAHKSVGRRHERFNYSALKRVSKTRELPVIHEGDLDESFVRGLCLPARTIVQLSSVFAGSGPGGQSINKTENNVQLLHKPSGIRINCQETRSLQQNRKIARRHLLERVRI